MSLSDYLRRELEAAAEPFTPAELRGGQGKRASPAVLLDSLRNERSP